MRAYFLTNMYLSPIQKGIQTAHAAAELMMVSDPKIQMWARDHKTIIVLDGGNSLDLQEAFAQLSKQTTYHPVAFYEDAGLNYALTCIGIVVDQTVVELIDSIRNNSDDMFEFFTPAQYEVARILSQYHLAR